MNYDIKTINKEDEKYPESLRAISKPPKTLYAIGNIELLKSESIAIVGSRDCSEYGLEMAKKFSWELANKGITIVSGMALRSG